MATWRNSITLIRRNDSVIEGTPNQPISELADRTQYLKDRLDAQAAGEGLVLFSQVISTDVVEGDAVYYNTANNDYEPAIASAAENDDGLLRTAESAYVVGIVIRKISTVAADILIQGRFGDIALTDASSVSLVDGNYYLSATAAGKLVNQRPAVAVFVCTVTDQGIIVNPTPREVLEDHVHYRFELRADPAGESMLVADQRVEIQCPNADQLGWLPYGNAVFQGNAPAGAYFGYNLWQDPVLAGVWPPQPTAGAYLEYGGTGVSKDHYRIDENGIWWMTDCEDHVPWRDQTHLSSSLCQEITGPSSSSSRAAAAMQPCDAEGEYLILWFTKLVAKTDQATVTGIKPAEGSPIVVTSCADPTSLGYFPSRVDLDLAMPWSRAANTGGSEVVKTVSGHGTLGVGHVVEGIQGAGLISVAGTETLAGGQRAGLVTLTGLDPTQMTRKLDVAIVALSGATEGMYENILPYVGLPDARASSFVGKIRVPQISMTDPRLRLVFWFGLIRAGTPPANVTLDYATVLNAETTEESSSSSLAFLYGSGFGIMPTEWTAWGDLDLEDLGTLTAGVYFARNTLVTSVSSDQLLLFQMSRTASDGYAWELAVINMYGLLYDNA